MGFIRFFMRHKPKIKVESAKKDSFSGWLKCSGCNEMIHAEELTGNHNCCSKCGFHYRLTVAQRIKLLTDEESFKELFDDVQPTDPLNFVDEEKYVDRLANARIKSGRDEAVCTGVATMDGHPIALGVMDFNFMGGSMGSVVGERLTRLIELAVVERRAVIIVSSSGGARMQESIYSLMQMAKSAGALAKLHQAKLPYISVLTNPTTGGVTASFATLGDVIMAEPKALICFAGPRVVEQTMKQKLPEGAQRSEFLQEKGMVDCIVERSQLKSKIVLFLDFFLPKRELAIESKKTKREESRFKRFLTAAVGGAR